MKLKTYVISLFLLFLLGTAGDFYISAIESGNELDTIAVNDIVSQLETDWELLRQPDYSLPGLSYGLDYFVLDSRGKLLASAGENPPSDENTAIRHRDTIITALDREGAVLGKVIFYNDTDEQWQHYKTRLLTVSLLMNSLVILSAAVILFLIHHKILTPFNALKNFARNIAGGNLDLPLPMDRNNIFGAFTESFDLMRTQLAAARERERKATADKKELVASLSHDIKTPVASIKAISELMQLKASDDKTRLQLETITSKADQINLLISNMFHATLEELTELKVSPLEMPSHEIHAMVQAADYQHSSHIHPIPGCLIVADPLRLAQVFDNIISNSYKYAGTEIHITFRTGEGFFIDITDYGPGVLLEELPLLTQKYFRGRNAGMKQGAGLGLYISKYFMEKMGGSLECISHNEGFTVRLRLNLA